MQTRTYRTYPVTDILGFYSLQNFCLQTLSWAETFSCFHFFTNNQHNHNYPYSGFLNMVTIGEREKINLKKGKVFSDLQSYLDSKEEMDWIIGYFGYDLKNEIEQLKSSNADFLQVSDSGFYVPQHIIFFRENSIQIATFGNPDDILKAILQTPFLNCSDPVFTGKLQQRTSKEKYITTVERLKEHILDGDVYEINYCMEFFAENAILHPLQAYQKLNELSPMPFSVYGKMDNIYLLCASPERFMKKQGSRLISMPIKGTTKRGSSLEEDTLFKQQLHGSEKERAENMMIVDLVRNDLAKSAISGSVAVEEMFGIYTFAALHQMISTVVAEIRPQMGVVNCIRNAFPMGSMTGAPKIKSMELIEQYEDMKRGLYSGAMGYFTPEGDFDFNVVIRSIQYNAESRYLSFSVGSAITYDAMAEQEYEECLLKAQSMYKALTTE